MYLQDKLFSMPVVGACVKGFEENQQAWAKSKQENQTAELNFCECLILKLLDEYGIYV